MPVKGGDLFLPVKAAIRKQLKKRPAIRRIVLFPDFTPYDVPQELIKCLQLEPLAHEHFLKLPEGEQKRTVEWIYDAKSDETKERRIAQVISRMLEK